MWQNKMIKQLFFLISLAGFFISNALANGIQEYNDGTYTYEVHYSVFSSSFLDPKIAKHYEILRSPNIGVVNIAVRRKQEVGTVAAISRVTGGVQNLLQQVRKLDFTEVSEGEAIYYLAQFRFSEGEILTFDLELMPDMRMGPVPLVFRKELFYDK